MRKLILILTAATAFGQNVITVLPGPSATGELRFLELPANGTNMVILKGPVSLAGDINVTWPVTPGSYTFAYKNLDNGFTTDQTFGGSIYAFGSTGTQIVKSNKLLVNYLAGSSAFQFEMGTANQLNLYDNSGSLITRWDTSIAPGFVSFVGRDVQSIRNLTITGTCTGCGSNLASNNIWTGTNTFNNSVVFNSIAAPNITYFNAPATFGAYLEFGQSGQYVEYQADATGNWLVGHYAVAAGVFQSIRTGAVTGTLVLQSGNATFGGNINAFTSGSQLVKSNKLLVNYNGGVSNFQFEMGTTNQLNLYDNSGSLMTRWDSTAAPGFVSFLGRDVQSIRNLTINGTCTGCGGGGPFSDSSYLFFNSVDATKRVSLSLASISTGTTRVLNIQNANYILAGKNIDNSFSTNQTFSGDVLAFSSGTQIVKSNKSVINYNGGSSNFDFEMGTTNQLNLYDNSGSLITRWDTSIAPGFVSFLGRDVQSIRNLTITGTCTGCPGSALLTTNNNWIGTNTFNNNFVLNGASGVNQVVYITAPSGFSSFLEIGPNLLWVEQSTNTAGDWLLGHFGVVPGVLQSIRSGAVTGTLILQNGNSTFAGNVLAFSTGTQIVKSNKLLVNYNGGASNFQFEMGTTNQMNLYDNSGSLMTRWDSSTAPGFVSFLGRDVQSIRNLTITGTCTGCSGTSLLSSNNFWTGSNTFSGGPVELITSGGASAFYYATSYGGFLGFIGQAATGTQASPFPTGLDQQMIAFGGRGRYNGGSGFTSSNSATISFNAGEIWSSSTNNGSYITMGTTPNGSATRSEKLRLNGAVDYQTAKVTGGVYTSLGFTADQGYYPKALGACSSLNSSNSTYGGWGYQGGSTYCFWNSSTLTWNAVNLASSGGGVTSVSGSFPITSTGGSTPVIACSTCFTTAGGQSVSGTSTFGNLTLTGSIDAFSGGSNYLKTNHLILNYLGGASNFQFQMDSANQMNLYDNAGGLITRWDTSAAPGFISFLSHDVQSIRNLTMSGTLTSSGGAAFTGGVGASGFNVTGGFNGIANQTLTVNTGAGTCTISVRGGIIWASTC